MKWLACLLTVACVGMAAAQTQTPVYTPTQTLQAQGIALRPWGSGTISETDETAYEGRTSIRVASRNYFQGGSIVYREAVNLSRFFDTKDNLLQFSFRIPRGSMVLGGAGGRPQAGQPQRQTVENEISTIRVIITTGDGKRTELFLDMMGRQENSRGWITVAIPLQAIPGFGETDKSIKSMAFSGDTIGTFYLGEVAMVNDSTPIYGEANVTNLNLALGDEVTFVASGFGGATVLRYTWDFDQSDGVGVDAIGQVVRRRFRKPGDYTVILTIADEYGLKTPHVSRIKVVVNP